MMEMSTANAGKLCVPPIKLVLMRELVSNTNTLRNLNSRILKASITATNDGMSVRVFFPTFFRIGFFSHFLLFGCFVHVALHLKKNY